MGKTRLLCASPLLALRAGMAGRGRVAASSRVFRGLCTSGPSGSDGSDAQDDGVVAEMPLAADIHAADGENESEDVGAIVEQAVERNRRGVMSWAGVGDDDDNTVDETEELVALYLKELGDALDADQGTAGSDLREPQTTHKANMVQIINVGRTHKPTKSGTVFKYRALVVAGNGNGAGGYGIGHGATERVSSQHQQNETGLNSNPVVSTVLEVMGIKDCTGRVIGRRNPYNVVPTVFRALYDHESVEDVALKRGKRIVSQS
eukprot:g304.t1